MPSLERLHNLCRPPVLQVLLYALFIISGAYFLRIDVLYHLLTKSGPKRISPRSNITSTNREAEWQSILVSYTLLTQLYLVPLTFILRINCVRSGGSLMYISLQKKILEDQIYETIISLINMRRFSRYGRNIN